MYVTVRGSVKTPWECKDTVTQSALKVDSGRKIPCRTWESNLHEPCAGPALYQLSNIPAQ